MIEESYVNFETAKLLKEKGFDVKPYHQYYVSRCGKVFGCKGNEMKQTTTNRGYKRVTLSINGKEERWSVHRLVALLFVPNPEQKPQVNHIDGNKENNDASNLEWCTASENNKHAFITGLKKNLVKGKYGKDHIASKPIVCVETGRVYNCQREVAEELGEDYKWTSHLSRACKYGLLDHGFHWRYYEPNELVRLLFEKGYTKYPLSYDGDYWFCYIQMVMKWLREVHNIVLVVDYEYECTDTSYYYKIYRLGEYGKPESVAVTGVSYDEDNNPTEHIVGFRDYSRGRYEYATYEEACEVAIKYCLENLI